MMQSAIFSTAYWPNLQYFFYVLNSQTIVLEKHEHYQKQSYRNRCQILTSNGVLDLIIPVIDAHQKQSVGEVKIAYKEAWQKKHWRSISTAYKNSSYFEYFEAEIKDLYETEFPYLLDFNTKQLQLLLKILRIKKEISFTETYLKPGAEKNDFRTKIHPKISHNANEQSLEALNRPYHQTFQTQGQFVPNLSILDLLFNAGLETKNYFLAR
jgi:hypothetical protein